MSREPQETRQGTTGYRTIHVGKGKNRRTLKCRIVRKKRPASKRSTSGQAQ